MTTQSVVFWDIDGTLVSGSLERTFLRYLRKQKFVRASSIPLNFLSLALRFPFPRWYQLKLCYLKGVHIEELISWAKSCWQNELESKLYSDAQNAIQRFTALGSRQVILSGTLKPLADQLAARVGIDDVIAANPEIDNHICTGRTASEHPQGLVKVMRVDEWLTANGLRWRDAIAVADNWQDRYLLERCGAPIAARPDERLRRHALKRGWRIVDELQEIEGLFPVVG